MHDKPEGVGVDPALNATGDEDAQDQSRVLRKVLDLNPEIKTRDELVRELTIASPEFNERDRIERAIRDLTAGGLLHVPKARGSRPGEGPPSLRRPITPLLWKPWAPK